MKNKIIGLSIILLIVLLAACKSDENPVASAPPSKLNGTWNENSVQFDDTLSISVTLNEKNGKITGGYDYLLKIVDYSGNTKFMIEDNRTSGSGLTGAFTGDKVNLSFGLFELSGNLSGDASKITGTAIHIINTDTIAYSVVLNKVK